MLLFRHACSCIINLMKEDIKSMPVKEIGQKKINIYKSRISDYYLGISYLPWLNN